MSAATGPDAPTPSIPGLVSARFAIDDGPVFWGHHDPDRRWNGWATPGFTRGWAERIAVWTDEGDAVTASWQGATLHLRYCDGEGPETEAIEPDEHGLYRFDGWCWEPSAEPAPISPRLDGLSAAAARAARVEVDAALARRDVPALGAALVRLGVPAEDGPEGLAAHLIAEPVARQRQLLDGIEVLNTDEREQAVVLARHQARLVRPA